MRVDGVLLFQNWVWRRIQTK